MDNKNTMDKSLYLPKAQVMNLLSQVDALTNKLNMAEAREKGLLEGLKWISAMIPQGFVEGWTREKFLLEQVHGCIEKAEETLATATALSQPTEGEANG